MRLLLFCARHALLLAGLALLLATLPGCDSDDRRREPLPPPGPQAQVRSFEVDFDVREAERAGAFRSSAYEALEISPAVAEDGLVMAYVRAPDTFAEDEQVWRALPYTYAFEFPDTDSTEAAVDYTVTLGFSYDVNFFEASYEVSADDPFVWDRLAERAPRRIRVVALAGRALRSNASLDVRDYEAVRRRFDLNP